LAAGLITDLIVDETTARLLVQDHSTVGGIARRHGSGVH
jgi:hypothetical protein